MLKHLKIQDMPLTPITDDLNIPTGAFGDVSVGITSVLNYFKSVPESYITNDSNLDIQNGSYQTLLVQEGATLECNLSEGQYIFVYVPTSSNHLDYRSFKICNQFNRDISKDSFILIFNMGGNLVLLGCNSNPIGGLG